MLYKLWSIALARIYKEMRRGLTLPLIYSGEMQDVTINENFIFITFRIDILTLNK